ncbi:MAG: SGNH/GDSL hydrolase family protein [Myxococcales bacterium]|nr:SGNH/GDSL hydrolase family protein [Myxococcales bacterium]
MAKSSAKIRLARAVSLLASLGLAALLAELAVRATWTEPWWEQLRAEQAGAIEGVHPERNKPTVYPVGEHRLPLRQAPRAEPKPPGTHRTLFLGDSFTYGLAIDPPDTFVGRIETAWSQDPPLAGVPRYEVWNGGIPGSLTTAWRALFAELGAAYQPDLVVAVFFLRDGVAGVTTMGQIDAIRDEMQRLARDSLAFRHSYLYRYLRARAEQRALSDRYLAQLRAGYLGSEAEQAEWWNARTQLLWLRKESRALGAEFALVIFPMLFALDADYPLEEVVEAIEAFALEKDIPVFSLLPAFRGRDASQLWLSPFDQHPNREGHAIAAEALRPFLEERMRAARGDAG